MSKRQLGKFKRKRKRFLFAAAQDQALVNFQLREGKTKRQESAESQSEKIDHLISGCSMLEKLVEYLKRHKKICKYVYQLDYLSRIWNGWTIQRMVQPPSKPDITTGGPIINTNKTVSASKQEKSRTNTWRLIT